MARIRQSRPDSGLGFQVKVLDRLRVGLTRRGTTHSREISGRGAARAEDSQGAPAQSHVSPSIQAYEDETF